MKTKIILAIAALGVVLLSPGCATRSMNTVEAAQPEGIPNMIADKRIITDPSLSRKVYVVGINESVTEAGYKKIQVELYNRTRSMKAFTYRVEWFDHEGMIISSPLDNRTPTQIEGGQKRNIAVLATSPKAVDFRFTFLESLKR